MGDIRVLIVDDSPTVCQFFRQGLFRVPGIEVVGVAPDPFVARDMIVNDPPDVVTLDIEMPRMDGLTFLRKLMMHFPLPVVVVSTLTVDGSQKAVEALESGAVDVVNKDMSAGNSRALMLELVQKIRSAAGSTVTARALARNRLKQGPATSAVPEVTTADGHLIAIGSSTGGTEALATVFRRLPANAPGTVVVQHMPPGFTAQMAERLNRLSAMEVREARDGDSITTGVALIAPGDRHLLVRRHGDSYVVALRDGPRVGRHKPSVDVLFTSVAEAAGSDAVGVILTGMGRDGTEGMARMKEQGAYNIAQDEESCVVYGMPRAAVERGATHETAPLKQMAERICQAVNGAVHA